MAFAAEDGYEDSFPGSRRGRAGRHSRHHEQEPSNMAVDGAVRVALGAKPFDESAGLVRGRGTPRSSGVCWDIEQRSWRFPQAWLGGENPTPTASATHAPSASAGAPPSRSPDPDRQRHLRGAGVNPRVLRRHPGRSPHRLPPLRGGAGRAPRFLRPPWRSSIRAARSDGA